MRGLRVSTLVAVSALVVAAPGRATAPPLPGFVRYQTGPDGGSIWQGVIPNPFVPHDYRPSEVYLPPGYSTGTRYPAVVLLHGMPGSAYSYLHSLRLARRADELIASGRTPPFVALIPVAGRNGRYDGEWTGPWERDVVESVVPWAEERLSLDPAALAIAGLSAGGYGAVDIGLRHPGLFATLESWSGYFAAPHDGTLVRLPAAALARYDPVRLAPAEAATLRADGTRFFLSSGTADPAAEVATRAFARELTALRLPHELWLGPGGHDDVFWREQLAPALEYAFRTVETPPYRARRRGTRPRSAVGIARRSASTRRTGTR
jgi:enterochelin esterase-like enzyme